MSTATMSPFASKASNKDKGDFEQAPPGSHPAVLIGLFDLGTHRSTFQNDQGEFPDIRQYFYVWELTAECDKSGNNFLVGQAYNASFHKKSGGRQMIEGWLSKTFADGEEFDPSTLLGRPGLATLVQENAKDGTPFVKLKGISPPPKGLTVPDASHPVMLFHLSMFVARPKEGELEKLVPDWLPRVFGKTAIDEVRTSHEFTALVPF